MIIECIADLHGYYPTLEGGDLLIVAGDLTARDTENNWNEFENWLTKQNYKEKIIIGGNHDNFLSSMDEHCMWKYWEKVGITYLCDSCTEFEYEELNWPNGFGVGIKKHKLKIWGSPWTKTFHGMNPKCKAFTFDTEEELGIKFSLIPHDIDILVTHCPPYGFFDQVLRESKLGHYKENTGSKFLRNHVMDTIKPQLHIFGHIHEWGGRMIDCCTTKFINASVVNEDYKHVNKPIRIIL